MKLAIDVKRAARIVILVLAVCAVFDWVRPQQDSTQAMKSADTGQVARTHSYSDTGAELCLDLGLVSIRLRLG